MTLATIPQTGNPPVATENHLNFAITLMEHLVVPTFVLDAESRVVIWNRACERLTGLPASEVLGTHDHWRAFYESPRPCLADLVASADYTGITDLYSLCDDPTQPLFGVHAENWVHDAATRPAPLSGRRRRPVYDESGRLIAVVETLRDITENIWRKARSSNRPAFSKPTTTSTNAKPTWPAGFSPIRSEATCWPKPASSIPSHQPRNFPAT